jgi:hypothetical protein
MAKTDKFLVQLTTQNIYWVIDAEAILSFRIDFVGLCVKACRPAAFVARRLAREATT